MSSVKDVWGHAKPARTYSQDSKWLLPKDFIGVEFEFENVRLLACEKYPYNDFWNREEDGSLRDLGIEFTLNGPMFGKDLEDALELMGRMANEQKFLTGYRTSVHVHLDVRDLSIKQIHKLCLFYTIFERAFFRFIGEERDKSNFCIPWFRSNSYFKYIAALNDPEPNNEKIRGYFHNLGRYSALNLDAIKTYGSLEFRAMHGCKDMEKVRGWINLIMSLKKAAREYPHESYAILQHLSQVGPGRFVEEIFEQRLQGFWDVNEVWTGVIEAQNLLCGAADMDFESPAQRLAILSGDGPIVSRFKQNSTKRPPFVLPELAVKAGTEE